MALRAIMLRKKLEEKKKFLDEARTKLKELKKREAELEQAIEDASTDEEKKAVEDEVEVYEKDKEAAEEELKNLDSEVAETERQLKELEDSQRVTAQQKQKEERSDLSVMDGRKKFFGMNAHERDAFMSRDDVKGFLERIRWLGKEERAVSGAELTIPTIILSLLRERIEEFSKLYRYVNTQPVSGKARQPIMGTIPEAVWTEMCGKINEIDLNFNDTEVDGYKVGGFIAICNSTLDDSDIALAETIITSLGQAIGLALDKAILYGTGTKMPLGIVTRLSQTSKPSDYPETARTWVDLHTSNIKTIATEKTGIGLFTEIIKATSAAKGRYATKEKFFAMNETTKTTLVTNALSFNAAGAIATGMGNTMPIIGGDIVTLDFIPDDNIIGGYGELYLLAEREGTSIARSEHVRFIEDQTVFKGTARYDGKPVIAEGFVAMTLNGKTPTTSVSFAPDKANAADSDNTDNANEAKG